MGGNLTGMKVSLNIVRIHSANDNAILKFINCYSNYDENISLLTTFVVQCPF